MRAFFEVHLRLVITVWVILLSVLSLLYLMNYMKFDSLMSTVVSSKLEVISTSLENSVKRAERLGISLQSANNVKEQINQARLRDDNVLAISLIDQQGKLIYQSSGFEDVRAIPVDVERRALKSNEPNWSYSNDSELFSGLQLTDGFGDLSGSIVIEYDKTALFGLYAQVRLHLLEATVLIFLASAAIVFLVIRLGFGDVINVIKLIQRYSSGENKVLDQAGQGAMSQSFAEQIKQSEKMKHLVDQELEQIRGLSNEEQAQEVGLKR